MLQRWEPAARDLITGLRIEGSSAFGLATREAVLPELVREAATARKAGRSDGARRLLDLAAQLAPDRPEIHRQGPMTPTVLQLPFAAELADARVVLVAGAGGG
ncbi:MAG TPA: hypothetical protein VGQ83_42590 [Polyangia bacterium]|jgi:hypothetical protein